jgi:hypothetical protein
MKERFQEARDALGEGPSPARRSLQRARLLTTRPAGGARVPARWWFPALAIVLVAVGLTTRERVRTGQTVEAGVEPSVLHFARGTTVTVSAGSSAYVQRVDDAQVDIVVTSGRIDAEVSKGTGRVWRYLAGPWVVRVVGTKLAVVWNAPSQVVDVDVSEGVVEVSREGQPPVLVHAGESLRRGPQAPVVTEPAPQHALPPQVVTPAAPVMKSRVAPPTSAKVTPSAPPGWRALLEQGQRSLAVQRAEEQNVMGEVESLNDGEALLLANAARLERHQSLAYQLLTVVSQRGGDHAAEALFLTGRMQLDAHELAAARASLTGSLRLAPEGPFSEQARGRLLELLMEMHDAEAASSVAHDYLERTPHGPWAGLARQVRSQP